MFQINNAAPERKHTGTEIQWTEIVRRKWGTFKDKKM